MSVLNQQLMKLAAHYADKSAFVDPATATGAMPPGGDPAAMGGMPPGGDPTAAGGAPPGPDPTLLAEIDALKQQVQQLTAAGGAGAGAGGEKPKVKVDVNTEIYQLKKMMVMLFNALEQEVPADMLLGDPAQDPGIPDEQAAQDPMSAAATQGGSAINPIEPIQGAMIPGAGMGGGGDKMASVLDQGEEFPSGAFSELQGRSAALLAMYRDRAAA